MLAELNVTDGVVAGKFSEKSKQGLNRFMKPFNFSLFLKLLEKRVTTEAVGA